MERFSQETCHSSNCEENIPTKAVITSYYRSYPDLLCHEVTIKISNAHCLNSVYKFDFDVGIEQQWRFKFFPRGKVLSSYYACAICLLNFPTFSPVHLTSVIITSSSIEFATTISKSVIPKEFWGFKYLSLKDSFIFKMEILEKVPIIDKHIQTKEDKEETNDELKSSDHSKLLFTAGDLTLFGPDWEHCCHKQVVVDKSPVFKAMFKHDTIESETCRVEIKDIKGPVVCSMLLYMYTNEPVGLATHINELTYAAVKYQIEDLKTYCINYMMNNLSVENAADFVFLSDLCDSKALRDRLLSFTTQNFKNIALTNGWQQVEKLSKTLSILIKVQACIIDDLKKEKN